MAGMMVPMGALAWRGVLRAHNLGPTSGFAGMQPWLIRCTELGIWR